MDIDPIDLTHGHGNHCPTHRLSRDAREEGLALTGGQQLRIGETGEGAVGVQNHRSRRHGPSQTATPRFVSPGDGAATLSVEGQFVRASGQEAGHR